MPTLDEMKCVVCEEVFTKEELAANEGLCKGCHEVMMEAAENVDEVEPGSRDQEVSPEMRKTIEAYRRRQEYMKEYNARPDKAAKRKEYMKGRNEKQKLILKRAKELGLL